jgi:putative intracellular protease/amidase
MPKILMIVTTADALTMSDGSSHPTGYWAEELAVSHRAFRDAGVDVDIATPDGVAPTVDQASLDPAIVGSEATVAELRDYLDSIADRLEHPLAIAGVDAAAYDAIFIPGGHGPMADLATDPDLGRLLVDADDREQIIAPLCHGPAALLSATRPDGSFQFAGRRLTTFTNEEELAGGTGEKTPWFVETRLRELGAAIDAGPAWSSTVVVDRNLISGQNPQSSAAAADQVLAALNVQTTA